MKLTIQDSKSEYMPHIDGLRCLAVMAVLLFHFGTPGMGGGYVGVDVFFVISGYLITKIITKEVASTGSFSFTSFYARRARRILPALIGTIVATTALAIVTLTPGDLVAYGKSMAASAVSLSNVLFWSESGYFDAVSRTKPLLHTWSLSVEEQFYLFWPAFIYISFKLFGKKWIGWSVVAAGIASFALNGVAVSAQGLDYKSDLFFLTHFRVFEFAIGAIGGFVTTRLPSSRLANELMMAAGLILIGASAALLTEGVVFPYVNALAPCVGALLVISARQARFVATLLTNKTSVWLGKISYSLYLVHWPIVVVVDQFLPSSAWHVKFALMASLSLASAALLHYKVEVPYRQVAGNNSRKHVVRSVIALSGAMCALGALFFVSNGMTWRYNYFTPGSFGIEPVVQTARFDKLPKAIAISVADSEPLGGQPEHQDLPVRASRADEATKDTESKNTPVKQHVDAAPKIDAPLLNRKAQSQSDQAAADREPEFKPLGASEIEAGKSRRFSEIIGGCNILSLDNPKRCFMDRSKQVLIFGNSHEPDALNMFNHLYSKDKEVNLISFGTVNNCELTIGETGISSSTAALSCDKRYKILNSDEFVSKLEFVVYNTHHGFDYIAKDLWSVLALLQKKNPNIKIIAIGSYLETTLECAALYNKFGTYEACGRREFVKYFNPDEKSKSPIPEVKTLDYLYISKYKMLCKGDGPESCVKFANGEPMFYDQHHLSFGFSKYVGSQIATKYLVELAKIGLPVPVGADAVAMPTGDTGAIASQRAASPAPAASVRP